MKKSGKTITIWIVAAVLLMPALLSAQESVLTMLPKPKMEGGKPLMQALKERHSAREFSAGPLSPQVLSNLLWAAAGMNRPGKRTVASAMNWQLVDVYVATAEGVYLYLAEPHALKKIAAQDLRALAGIQPFVKDAPLNLIFVADFDRMKIKVPEPENYIYAASEAGAMGQDVYLFCASEGLNAVIRASMKKAELAKAMNLRPSQRILLAQTLGYPKAAQ